MSELIFFNAAEAALKLVGRDFSYVGNITVIGFYVTVAGLSLNGTPLERHVYLGKGAL